MHAHCRSRVQPHDVKATARWWLRGCQSSQHLSLEKLLGGILQKLSKPRRAVLDRWPSEVTGIVEQTGRFVATDAGYIPIYCRHGPCGFALVEQWLVESDVGRTSKFQTLSYMARKENGDWTKTQRTEQCGRLVYGVQVEENMVRFDRNLYMPVKLNGETVLWRQKISAQDWVQGTETARLYLLATPGDYYITGTFTQSWRGKLKLVADSQALSGLDFGTKQLFYVDIQVTELQGAEFKFRHHKKGAYDTVRRLFAGEYMVWEYSSSKINRRVSPHVAAGSKLFACWGKQEVDEEDVISFLKVVWSEDALLDLDVTVQKAQEVRESLSLMTCPAPCGPPEELFTRALPKALRQAILRVGKEPCPGVYLWMAVLTERKASLLQQVRHEVISIIAAWPVELMSHSKLSGHIGATAREILVQGDCARLPQSWLLAAIQVILHSEAPEEMRCFCEKALGLAARLDGDAAPDWATVMGSAESIQGLELALGLALQPAKSPQQVWLTASAFLTQARKVFGTSLDAAGAKLALERALRCHAASPVMDWAMVASELQTFLDDFQLTSQEMERQLSQIIEEGFNRYGARRNRVPHVDGNLGSALMILARGLTADPSSVVFVTFEAGSACCWLQLAAASGTAGEVPFSACLGSKRNE